MPFKKISSIISDAKYSFGNNPYNFFQLLIVLVFLIRMLTFDVPF